MGISGNFFACLKHMYENSKTRIKLIQKLSKSIDVTIGTEQGHPLSPELFKMFIHDLSVNLAELGDISVPHLNEFPISHLLWADDLILIALDNKSLQTQQSTGLSSELCNQMGTVNKPSEDKYYGIQQWI